MTSALHWPKAANCVPRHMSRVLLLCHEVQGAAVPTGGDFGPSRSGPMAGDRKPNPTYRGVVETTTFSFVGDLMSAPVVVVRDYDTIWRAVDRFATTGLHHLVVLDADDQLVGILDDRQAIALWPFDVAASHSRTIGELLRSGGAAKTSEVARIHPSATLRIAGRLMLQQRVDALAVADDFGRVVGILTGSDLIEGLIRDPE
jgi:CBS domain-containing protein